MKRLFWAAAALFAAAFVCSAQPGGNAAEPTPQQMEAIFRRMSVPPEDPAFRREEIALTSAGNRLYGEAFFPVAPGRHPAVIMSHGYNGSHTTFYPIIRELAKEGYVCVCYDFAGGGTRSRSEGDSRQMSIFTERQNLEDVIALVRSWDAVDAGNVFLLGESQGGCVSAITAPYVADRIRAAVLYFPALCIPDDALERYPKYADVPEAHNFMGLDIGRPYYDARFYEGWDIYAEIAQYTGPVLIVHGTNDALVKPEYSARAANVYRDCELHLLFGGGHGVRPDTQDQYIAYTRDFLARHRK